MRLRAAARGLIDFREADQRSRGWQLRVQLLLRALVLEDDLRLHDALHRHHLAVLGVYRISSDSLNAAQKAARGQLEELFSGLFPWQFPRLTEAQKQSQAAQHDRNAWQQHFGALDNPETQEKLRRVREALLLKSATAAPPPSPRAQQGVFNRDTAGQIQALQPL